jgi:hypothetical protein
VRISDPGVVAGLYTPEEIGDFAAEPARPAPAVASFSPPVIDAEVVSSAPPEPKASAEAIKALCAAMTAAGIRDREDVLAWCAERIGHAVASRKDLTASECAKCIDAARAPLPGQPEREAGEEG